MSSFLYNVDQTKGVLNAVMPPQNNQGPSLGHDRDRDSKAGGSSNQHDCESELRRESHGIK